MDRLPDWAIALYVIGSVGAIFYSVLRDFRLDDWMDRPGLSGRAVQPNKLLESSGSGEDLVGFVCLSVEPSSNVRSSERRK